MRVLIIEDEEKIASFLQRGLREEGYLTDLAGDGEEGFLLALDGDYDLVVLDVMLPRKNGLLVCKELRQKRKGVPILMLSAKDTVTDKVLGLDTGADDYLTKPFAFEEFLARVRALLRKKDNLLGNVLVVEDLCLDLMSRRVTRAGVEVELSNKEYGLLEYLMRNAGRVVTRTMISEHVWNIDFDTFTNVIDVYINYLRKKVDADHPHKLIRTLRGRGYMLGSNS